MSAPRIHQTPHLRIVVGKIGGAVGTQASFGDRGIVIQQKTMEYLGIGSVEIANQIVQRDRHAEFVMWMANTATTLDKICTAVRNLQRSEIAEHTGRQEAHSIVRECSIAAHEGGRHLLDVLLERGDVTAHLDADEIAAAMDPYQYIGTAVRQVEAVVARLRTRA